MELIERLNYYADRCEYTAELNPKGEADTLREAAKEISSLRKQIAEIIGKAIMEVESIAAQEEKK